MRQLTTPDFDKLTGHITNFKGAWPYDRLPKRLTQPYSVVLNTDDHTKPGEHWVCVYVDANQIFFGDSFGRHPSDLSFPRRFSMLLRRLTRGRRLIFNDRLIQDLTSQACGLYCLYMLDCLALNKSKRKFFAVFDKDLVKNDRFVLKYYKHNFA